MIDKYGTGQDPYCYPGSSILRNRFNIRDESILEEAEREITTIASNNILFSPPPYNFEYFKSIHRVLFARIYEWAGELRSIDISKDDTRFCVTNRIEPEADKLFKNLKAEDYFANLSDEQFAKAIAELYGDINMLHPFREGNGRAQRILFEHIALNAGYTIDWSIATTEQWKEANIRAVACDYQDLTDIIKHGLNSIA